VVPHEKKTAYWLLPLVVLSMSIAGYAQLQVPVPTTHRSLAKKPPDFELPKGLGAQGRHAWNERFRWEEESAFGFLPRAFTAG